MIKRVVSLNVWQKRTYSQNSWDGDVHSVFHVTPVSFGNWVTSLTQGTSGLVSLSGKQQLVAHSPQMVQGSSDWNEYHI